jgi:hypothetical protein
VLSLVPAFASADEPTLAEWAQQRVEDGLVKPLAHIETHAFSRSRPPPRERRVRVLQTTAMLDKNKHSFVPFAIDVRFGSAEWHENDIVGCVYAGAGKLYVKRGDGYRPASFLLGKNEDVVPGVCEKVD